MLKDYLKNETQPERKKDWAEADRLRDELKELGYQIEDSAYGASLKKI